MNRTFNTKRNLIYSFVAQIIILFLNFISRTIFIKELGNEVLGINSLFTNILTLLSLTELGFTNAIIYSLYKPLAQNDKEEIAGIMNFYKKVYSYVAIAILFIGIILLPFIPKFINLDENSNILMSQIKIYYLLFLLNSLSSYLFAYKANLIMADQKNYIIKKYTLITTIILFSLQTITLIYFKNYLLFLIIQVIMTFVNNLIISNKAKNMYPFINNKNIHIKESIKKKIFDNVKSIFIYKIATNLVENVDNILISVMVGTLYVGLYSNYHMITTSLLGFVTMFFSSFTASIGNLNVTSDNSKKESVFSEVMIIDSFIMVISTICLINCFPIFIKIWVGGENVLSTELTLTIAFNFYIFGVLNPVCIYRDTTGIFKEAKNIAVILAFLNLLLSILFGIKYGMLGILIATGISKLLTNFWYQPFILYKDVFKCSSKNYFLKQIIYLLIIFLSIIITTNIMRHIHINDYLNLLIALIISCIIPFILLLIYQIRDPNFKKLISRLNIKETFNKLN